MAFSQQISSKYNLAYENDWKRRIILVFVSHVSTSTSFEWDSYYFSVQIQVIPANFHFNLKKK